MIATAATTPINLANGPVVMPCSDVKSNAGWLAIRCPQDILLDDGEFVIVSPKGYQRICTLTGRTRWFGKWLAATIDTHEIESTVKYLPDGTPAMFGIRGRKCKDGTWAISNSSVVK